MPNDRAPSPLTFPRSRRLTHAREFNAAHREGLRQMRGPLVVYGVRNGLTHARLGLSVSRRVGIAVKRNRIKRLLREAFRLNQSALPPGVDLVVSVRPHTPLPLKRYEEILLSCAALLGRDLDKRAARARAAEASSATAPPDGADAPPPNEQPGG